MRLSRVLWGAGAGGGLALALWFGSSVPGFSERSSFTLTELSTRLGFRFTPPEPGARRVDGVRAEIVEASAVAPSGEAADPQGSVRVASLGAVNVVDPGASAVAPVVTTPAEPPSADHLHPSHYLGALSKETPIHEKPSTRSTILGFARTGSLLRRAELAKGHDGCKEGWYRVEPEGYVCVNKAATLDMEHPLLQLASFQPDRSLPLPYVYGRSRYPTPPFYTRIPTDAEQAQAEQDLTGHRKKNFGEKWQEHADTAPPILLEKGERIPRPYGYPRLEREFMTGRALTNSAFAFIDLFESGGRQWGLTADLSLLPLDRLTIVEPSQFSGLILAGDTLPVAFVRSETQQLYRRDEASGAFALVRPIAYRESFVLTGRRERSGQGVFLETKSGEFLRENDRLVRIEPKEKLPKWATGKRSWIDVSILRQTLVAYEGPTPVFATLVSTGRDGIQDPETTHSTVQGVYLIHTKHVTATMSGDEADDEFDLRDVPYVQYFHEGYAFHAAFWHDGYGGPRSHGCINLSPSDARYLFTWTDPPVPQRWHSALSRSGTLVYIHP